jgi:hypothetical protein
VPGAGGGATVAPGTVIGGQYEVERALGQGGMGVVFRARDRRLERDVAIKVGSLVSPSALRRVEREAIALAKLSHPNVVVVHQVGELNGRLYIAMELVAGGNAREWLAAAPRTWREIVALYVDAARGLAAAHAAGFVHRDFKPDNVLVGGDGRPRVADFGLVRDVSSSEPAASDGGAPTPGSRTSERVTEAGVIVGTPAYMAPEQLEPGEIDAAADQFAFCVSLWEALHGVRPFRASGRGAMMRAGLRAQIVAGRITPAERRGVPRRVDAIVRRGLAADPAKRWPSMGALIAALERAARRRTRDVAIAAGAAAIVAGAAVIAWRPWAGADAAAPQLRAGSPRALDRAAGPRDLRVLVGDGRVARADGGAIELTAPAGASPMRIAAPGGGAIVDLHRSQEPGWLVATEQDGAACTIWHVALDGRAPVRLADGCGAEVAVAPGGAAIAIARPGVLTVRDAAGAPRPRWTHPLADADPGVPAWSPDGARVAIASGRDTIVLDAATGDELARAPGRDGAAWWDDHRLVHVRREGFGRSELRLLELGGAQSDAHLHSEDGLLGAPSLDGNALLALREVAGGRAYVVPSAPSAPIELDAAAPLDTGWTADVALAGWTDDGKIVTLSARGADAGVVVTAPGARGAALAVRRGSPGGGAVTAGRAIYDVRGADNLCERRAIELATGAETASHRVSCLEDVWLTCARDAGRCIDVSGKGARWVDATGGGVVGPAPAIDAPVLSPDGRAIATIAAGRLAVRPSSGGADAAIVPVPPWPPDARAHVLAWSRDELELLVAVDDPATGDHALVAISRDGRWRAIARGVARSIVAAQPAPDGGSVAVIAREPAGEWIEFPMFMGK